MDVCTPKSLVIDRFNTLHIVNVRFALASILLIDSDASYDVRGMKYPCLPLSILSLEQINIPHLRNRSIVICTRLINIPQADASALPVIAFLIPLQYDCK